MDKNTIIGIVLMGLLLFGFTFYQNKQYQKQAAYQAQLDSIAAVERFRADSLAAAEALRDTSRSLSGVEGSGVEGSGVEVSAAPIYKDSLLEASRSAEGEIITLSNDKFEVAFTTKGAQPYSAMIKDYKTYGGEDLYLFKPGTSQFGLQVYAGEMVNPSDFIFQVAEKTATTLAMRLPFSGGGYIEQRYSIKEGEYMVRNNLSFVGMENVIPKNVFSVDLDYSMTIPRLEKGYILARQCGIYPEFEEIAAGLRRHGRVPVFQAGLVFLRREEACRHRPRPLCQQEGGQQGRLVRFPAAVLLGHIQGSQRVHLRRI